MDFAYLYEFDESNVHDEQYSWRSDNDSGDDGSDDNDSDEDVSSDADEGEGEKESSEERPDLEQEYFNSSPTSDPSANSTTTNAIDDTPLRSQPRFRSHSESQPPGPTISVYNIVVPRKAIDSEWMLYNNDANLKPEDELDLLIGSLVNVRLDGDIDNNRGSRGTGTNVHRLRSRNVDQVPSAAATHVCSREENGENPEASGTWALDDLTRALPGVECVDREHSPR